VHLVHVRLLGPLTATKALILSYFCCLHPFSLGEKEKKYHRYKSLSVAPAKNHNNNDNYNDILI
jgi:hypothetical protein